MQRINLHSTARRSLKIDMHSTRLRTVRTKIQFLLNISAVLSSLLKWRHHKNLTSRIHRISVTTWRALTDKLTIAGRHLITMFAITTFGIQHLGKDTYILDRTTFPLNVHQSLLLHVCLILQTLLIAIRKTILLPLNCLLS